MRKFGNDSVVLAPAATSSGGHMVANPGVGGSSDAMMSVDPLTVYARDAQFGNLRASLEHVISGVSRLGGVGALVAAIGAVGYFLI